MESHREGPGTKGKSSAQNSPSAESSSVPEVTIPDQSNVHWVHQERSREGDYADHDPLAEGCATHCTPNASAHRWRPLTDSRIAKAHRGAAIRCSGVFAAFAPRPREVQEFRAHQVLHPAFIGCGPLKMDSQPPRRLVCPKLATMQGHNLIAFHAAQFVVEGSQVLARNAEPVAGWVRNDHLIQVP
jgi:hypothetical protein